MSDEQRMADVRSKLFTLFDVEEERGRELDEQNRLKNRATGAFQIFKKNVIGGDEEAEDDGSASRASARRPAGAPGRERPPQGGQSRQPARQGQDQPQSRPARQGQPQQPAHQEQDQPQSRPARQGQPQQPAHQGAQRSGRYEEDQMKIERPAREQFGRERIEQEQRVKPVNPVKAKGAGESGRPGESDFAERTPRREDVISEPAAKKAPSRKTEAPEEATPKTSAKKTAPKKPEAPKSPTKKASAPKSEAREEMAPETKTSKATNTEDERYGSVPQDGQEASFRLGDLFKDKEPDIFSQWDKQDEEERRIHARREKRRAEAARRAHGEDEDSKMKTAAALFVMREGIRNVFGKVSGPITHNEEREEQEREAERALNELAAAKEEAYPPMREPRSRMPLIKTEDDADALEAPEENPASNEEKKSPTKAKRKRVVEQEQDSAPEPVQKDISESEEDTAAQPEKKTAAQSEKDTAAQPEKKTTARPEKDAGAQPEKKTTTRPERKAFSEAKEKPAVKSDLPPANPRRLQKSVDVADDDSGYESASFFDYFKNPSRPSRTMIAWIAGGAAGAVAVILIALMIVNNHAADMIASGF